MNLMTSLGIGGTVTPEPSQWAKVRGQCSLDFVWGTPTPIQKPHMDPLSQKISFPREIATADSLEK